MTTRGPSPMSLQRGIKDAFPQFKTSKWRRAFGAALVACAAALSVVAAFTAYEVLTNFREFRTEASDNIEWSLAQTELETRDFTAALETAMLDPEGDLDRLRLRYDIFYSRIVTMLNSPNYQRLNVTPEFEGALQRVRRFLDSSVALIDGPDADLRAALPLLAEQSGHLRNDTRTLSLKGLTYFAEHADDRRERVTGTLLRLTFSAVLLVAALVALIIHVFSLYRRTHEHNQAIEQANDRMNTILTASFDGVMVIDSAARVLEFNKACEVMFQHHFEDIKGRNFLDFGVAADKRAQHAKALERIIAQQANHVAGTGPIRMDAQRGDGTLFPVEVSLETAQEDDRIIVIAFIHDISDRIAAEHELVRARDSALAGEKAKAEFLTVMSHEIRTPLNGLLGNLSLLNDTAPNDTQLRYIRNMEISGRVLMRHVDTVLNIARYEAGVTAVSVADTDLTMMLQELVDSQLSAATAHGSALSWRWEGTPFPWVRTDRAAVEQVLLNLIGNAIKFTENGAITIEAEALPDDDDTMTLVEFRVIDNGVGIAEDRIARVFEDFVTNDSTYGRVPGGTGLGLGIASRIVKTLGGDIGVESTQGVGSVFWFRLPLEKGDRPSEATVPTPSTDQMPLNILVVEDNIINCELTEEILINEGNTATCVNNGLEALEHAKVHKYDLILMDISMPVMDGLQATVAIRNSDGPNTDTPIIAFSANILPAERERLLAHGMDGFLAKPLNRTALQERLQQAYADGRDHPQDLDDITGEKVHADATEDIFDTNSPYPLLDILAFQNNRTGLPDATFQRLLSRFVDEGDALNAAITAPYRNSSKVARMCHDLASASAVFGARAYHERLITADTATKQNDTAAFENELTTLPALWHKTRAALIAQVPAVSEG
ncbi:response regulator [Shimia sp. R11_0]|uniref:ATP-binding protein n=1 Tax=Shimia sp. R11_0 TaxID=2821096 RepID=UPI001AD9D31D|nr:PAS domain-containing hybrid sensor histidine kinase/response regulator [Shimia sp. R11_0]MBO9478839.1 response regulator [Shimia sp. R11_0]